MTSNNIGSDIDDEIIQNYLQTLKTGQFVYKDGTFNAFDLYNKEKVVVVQRFFGELSSLLSCTDNLEKRCRSEVRYLDKFSFCHLKKSIHEKLEQINKIAMNLINFILASIDKSNPTEIREQEIFTRIFAGIKRTAEIY